MLPFISVIIPCRNEERFIGPCLDTVLANDYPKDRLEIAVVDGASEDRTREIVGEYARKHPFIRLLDNPKKTAPAALNIGIRNTKGEIVIRLDAHTTYSEHYLSKSIESLKRHGAANVGGIIKTMPGCDTLTARAIAYAISHPFGVGLSHFRLAKKETRYVDTVPFGCFRRDLFSKVGLFDEALPRNEDIDMNMRIRAAGGKIVLNPEIVSYYYARGTLKDFWKHNFDNGYLVTAPLEMHKMNCSVRHLVPLAALFALIVSMGLAFASSYFRWLVGGLIASYFAFDLYFSFKAALRQKNPVHFLLMPLVFLCLHLSYGLGSLYGLLKAAQMKTKLAPPT